jgi:hypothetical protein
MPALSFKECPLERHGSFCGEYHGRWWFFRSVRCFCSCHEKGR